MCTGLTLFIVISRSIISSRPSSSLSAFLLVPQMRLLLTILRISYIYLLTYLSSFWAFVVNHIVLFFYINFMQGTLEVSVRTSCPSGFVQYQCCSCI